MKLDSEDYQRQQREQAEKQRRDQEYHRQVKEDWERRQIREETIRQADAKRKRKQEALNKQRELENQTGSGNKKTSLKFDWQWFWISGFFGTIGILTIPNLPIIGKATLAVILAVAFGYFWKQIFWILGISAIFYIALHSKS